MSADPSALLVGQRYELKPESIRCELSGWGVVSSYPYLVAGIRYERASVFDNTLPSLPFERMGTCGYLSFEADLDKWRFWPNGDRLGPYPLRELLESGYCIDSFAATLGRQLMAGNSRVRSIVGMLSREAEHAKRRSVPMRIGRDALDDLDALSPLLG